MCTRNTTVAGQRVIKEIRPKEHAMTVSYLLTNWDDYNRQKFSRFGSVEKFDPAADWEVAYLTEKIRQIYPFIPDATIIQTIRQYSAELPGLCDREEFVACVLERLGIPL